MEQTLRQMCTQLGLSRRAVQGYEKAGLVAPSGRNKYGHLLYGQPEQERVRLIQFYQQLGFHLKEIKVLLETDKFIIQKIDDADAKILVSDGNLHRPKISTYDLSRTLRMKMEGMKQKAGRRKKGFTAEELNSDEKLAKEMGMSVSKLNRIIRLSEASKEVCNRVDDGTLPLSAASALSFLKPENQDVALHLTDLGYKLPTERIEYLKKVEKAGKLDEMTMRKVLDGENVLEPPKVSSASFLTATMCLSTFWLVCFTPRHFRSFTFRRTRYMGAACLFQSGSCLMNLQMWHSLTAMPVYRLP